MTLFILQHRTRDHVTTYPTKMHATVASGTEGWGSEGAHLELLQLPDIAFTLADQLSHLVLMLLLLMLPLCLLSLLLLQWKLKEDKLTVSQKSREIREGGRHLSVSHLFDPLPLFAGADCWVDADALLKDGQTGLCLAALDLRQPVLLLLLPRFQILDHPLVVALHVFQLLWQQKMELEMDGWRTF